MRQLAPDSARVMWSDTGLAVASDSVIVLFALVAYGEHRHRLRVLYLEQRDVARATEGNDQFAQERPAGTADSLAAGERKDSQ